MQEVERQIQEDTYGGLKAREARLKGRHDVYVSRKESEELRKIAKLKLQEKVRPSRDLVMVLAEALRATR
jgi:hypothetical protein